MVSLKPSRLVRLVIPQGMYISVVFSQIMLRMIFATDLDEAANEHYVNSLGFAIIFLVGGLELGVPGPPPPKSYPNPNLMRLLGSRALRFTR